jgi:hypothetical protein
MSNNGPPSSRLDKIRAVKARLAEQLADVLIDAHDGRADLLEERDTLRRLLDAFQAAEIAEEYEEDRGG